MLWTSCGIDLSSGLSGPFPNTFSLFLDEGVMWLTWQQARDSLCAVSERLLRSILKFTEDNLPPRQTFSG